ncbi:MAG: carbon starvation protein A [Bacilli bacterium]|nr:carbon starvation protein A [Bacilli bacterium]
MWTFFIALALLIGGYFIYSRVSEKIFVPDGRATPAMHCPDGVDITPMPKWKAFLIELLNIAGTGPIFGAISGALFGPIVFLWIVFGCILGGAVHDYFSGMISSRNTGASIVKLSGKYLGKAFEIIMRFFSIVLLVLVTAVFVVSPSTLLETLTHGSVVAWVWMIIILGYYLLSAVVPIDKIIGKAYPVFGVILIAMALAAIIGILCHQGTYPMLEIIGNFKDFSAQNGGLPWWPFMLTTVACGAVSGFHATQSPMIAKCIKSEKEGRQVFYGAMVAEGVIALIWAAAAMAFYHVNEADGWQSLNAVGGSSASVYTIASTLLGPFGTVLAVIGVVICPITSGDTALRSCRLIVGEWLHLDQKKLKNRLILTLPLFAMVAGISLWDFMAPSNFGLLWRWFAWSNQLLAAACLWVITGYLLQDGHKRIRSLFTAIPAFLMTAVVITYILAEPNIALGRFIPAAVAYPLGFGVSVLIFGFYLFVLFAPLRWKNWLPKPPGDAKEEEPIN